MRAHSDCQHLAERRRTRRLLGQLEHGVEARLAAGVNLRDGGGRAVPSTCQIHLSLPPY